MMQRIQCTQAIPHQGVQSVRNRRGLTLLEVLVSVAIFLGSFTAIMQLLNTGQQAEVSARLQSEAVLRCDAKMAEIVAGVEKPVSSADSTFPDDEIGNWKWSANVTNGTATSLLKITVTVEHTPDGKNPNAAFTLTRYMRDPQLFIDAALAATAAAAETSSSSGTSSNSGASSKSGNTTGTGTTGGGNNGGGNNGGGNGGGGNGGGGNGGGAIKSIE